MKRSRTKPSFFRSPVLSCRALLSPCRCWLAPSLRPGPCRSCRRPCRLSQGRASLIISPALYRSVRSLVTAASINAFPSSSAASSTMPEPSFSLSASAISRSSFASPETLAASTLTSSDFLHGVYKLSGRACFLFTLEFLNFALEFLRVVKELSYLVGDLGPRSLQELGSFP